MNAWWAVRGGIIAGRVDSKVIEAKVKRNLGAQTYPQDGKSEGRYTLTYLQRFQQLK